MRIYYHGAEPTVVPGVGIVKPGWAEVPDGIGAALLVAGARTGDYSATGPEEKKGKAAGKGKAEKGE